MISTVGFPKIKNFGGDIRDFLPSLFIYLKKFENIEVFLEKGYGSGFGLNEIDYIKVNPKIKFVPEEEVYKKDLIVIIKMPELKDLEKLKDGCSIFTMCHYHTRASYVELFKIKGIKSFSMDAVVDDYGKRIFVDYFRTAYNGSAIAFNELKKSMPDFYSSHRRPINVTVLGVGFVAQNCARSFEILGDEEFLGKSIPGIVIRLLPRTVTYSRSLMKTILETTDVLTDATSRRDLSEVIVENSSLSYLPEHAIILDLAADRYDEAQVKPIEGTILGNLSKMVIYGNDELYNDLPRNVKSKNRRTTVSCNAWPGVTPKESIQFYELLLKDYLNILLTKDTEEINKESDNYFERALYRSSLSNYLNNF